MDIYTGISIAVSIIALIISIVSHKMSKAINNQIQLQNNYSELCQKLQKLISWGTEDNLISFKYDIENYTYYDKDSIESCKEFNNLQKTFYKQKIQLKSDYIELMENFDFLNIKVFFSNISKENKFDIWLNDNINTYFLKLDKFYDDLVQILTLTRGAQNGISNPNEKQIIDAFFDNIIDIIRISQALQLLKTKMAGYFKKISVREIHVFNDNEILISNIKKEMYSYVMEFGIDDAITSANFSKIREHCLDFGKYFDNFILEEKKDYATFLSIIKNRTNKNK